MQLRGEEVENCNHETAKSACIHYPKVLKVLSPGTSTIDGEYHTVRSCSEIWQDTALLGVPLAPFRHAIEWINGFCRWSLLALQSSLGYNAIAVLVQYCVEGPSLNLISQLHVVSYRPLLGVCDGYRTRGMVSRVKRSRLWFVAVIQQLCGIVVSGDVCIADMASGSSDGCLASRSHGIDSRRFQLAS